MSTDELLRSFASLIQTQYDSQPEPEATEPPVEGIPVAVAPVPGATVHAQALSKWLNDKLPKIPGARFTEDTVATLARTGTTITDPEKMREFIRIVAGVRLVPGPLLKLQSKGSKKRGPDDTWPREVVEKKLAECLVEYYADDLPELAGKPFSEVQEVVCDEMRREAILRNEYVYDLLHYWTMFSDEHMWIHLCNHINTDITEELFRTNIEEGAAKLKADKEQAAAAATAQAKAKEAAAAAPKPVPAAAPEQAASSASV